MLKDLVHLSEKLQLIFDFLKNLEDDVHLINNKKIKLEKEVNKLKK